MILTRIRKALDENEQGFTLIELLVVIIIIGILAAIAIPVFLNQRKKGVDASMKSDLKNAATQLETYYTDSNSYGQGGRYSCGNPALGVCGSDTTATPPAGLKGFFKASPNNVVNVDTSAGGYCIDVVNPGSSLGATGKLYYNSTLGGLQPTGATSCGAF